MTVVHTYFYIVVDTQRGCHNLKLVLDVGTPNGTSRFDVLHYLQQQEWQGMSHFLFYSVFMGVGLSVTFLVKVNFFFLPNIT